MPALPLAADYPFMDVLWSMLIFTCLFMWIWLAISVFADIFRRDDMGGFLKALWVVAVIIIPFVGVLVYLIAYHRSIAERNLRGVQEAQDQFDARVRQAAAASGPATPADQIAKAQQLRDAGTISDEEFEQLKRSALAAA